MPRPPPSARSNRSRLRQALTPMWLEQLSSPELRPQQRGSTAAAAAAAARRQAAPCLPRVLVTASALFSVAAASYNLMYHTADHYRTLIQTW
eukprot:gene7101-54525_t